MIVEDDLHISVYYKRTNADGSTSEVELPVIEVHVTQLLWYYRQHWYVCSTLLCVRRLLLSCYSLP